MNTKESARHFLIELETVVKTLHTYDENFHQIKSQVMLAGDSAVIAEQMKELKANQAKLSEVYQASLAKAQEFANRDTLEEISDLYNDMNINMNQASELYQDWRKAKSRFALLVATNEFENDEERVNYEQELVYLHQRYDAAMQLVLDFVPTGKGVVNLG